MIPRITVVVPTLNPGSQAHELCEAISRQSVPPVEVIILDSESDDGSREFFAAAGARVEVVRRSTFNHGRVRNLGFALATGNIVVFMTQDAVPADLRCFEQLVAPLVAGSVDAAFARQLPRADATPIERFARLRNYPAEARTIRPEDVSSDGVMAYFFSDVCSAIRRDVLHRVGGFPEHTVTNEDMLFAARLLRSGGSIGYVSDARVYHSHSLGPIWTFRRYFDIGAFFVQAEAELTKRRLTESGLAYVVALLRWLLQYREYGSIVPALIETTAKWVGLRMGTLYPRLPPSVTRRLSGHPSFWTNESGR